MAETITAGSSPAQTRSARRLGWKAEVAGIALVVVALLGDLGSYLLGQITQPSAYAADYVSALASGDPSTIWSLISVQSPATPADASFVDRAALAAMLTGSGNRQSVSDVQAKTVSADSSTAAVVVSYHQGSLARQQTLNLRLDASARRYLVYPVWRVQVTPAILNVVLPAGAGAISLDGRSVPAGAKSLAVYPGVHSVALGASALFLADREGVTAGTSPTTVVFKIHLTDAAQSQAASALAAAMGACAKATTLQPAGCPQAVVDNITGGAQWQLYGDPTQGVTYAEDADGHIATDGRYQMAVSYVGVAPAVARHRAVAGGYHAIFGWDGQQLRVKSISSTSAPLTEVPRPAIDDSTVLAQVKAAFDQCSSATVPNPAGCPQSVYTLGTLGNFHWRVDSDPMAGTTVTYSGNQAMYRITGSYAMTATYDETFPYQPTFHRSSQDAGHYIADVFWDGQKTVFVAFE